MYYVGLDSHWKTSTACILDSNGKEVTIFTVRGGWSKMIQRLETFVKAAAEPNAKLAICYEASCGYGALYDRLARIAHRLVVAHPGHLRLIFRSKTKNDRMDARRLAKLLFLDEVPRVHVPKSETRDWRKMIEFHRSTVDKRTQVKNAIQSLLRGHGIAKPKDLKSLWGGHGRAWLQSRGLIARAIDESIAGCGEHSGGGGASGDSAAGCGQDARGDRIPGPSRHAGGVCRAHA